MQRRSFNWVVALVGIGLAGVVAVSAATALAARTAASPFELVFQGRWEWDNEQDKQFDPEGFFTFFIGSFASGEPFCESGTADYPDPFDTRVRYTCGDGSGSLTIKPVKTTFPPSARGGNEWTIVEGSGRYADLRGKGTYNGVVLDEDPDDLVIPLRTTLQGFAAADAVAPGLAFTGASATKRRRPSGFYAIRVAVSLRDDVEGNAVAYRLRVTEGPEHARDRRRPLLAEKSGSTASGSVSTTLRFFPSSKRVRSVQLLLSGSDPVGNEVTIARSLKLPR